MTAPAQLARKAIAMPLAVVFLALSPAGAWGVADVIKNSGISFDKPTYYSDQGDLVQFEHTGLPFPHNVTSTQSLFASATLFLNGTTAVNGTESLAPGTYPFICTIHPLQMRADLVVRLPPSNEFSFGKVKKNQKKGTATLTVLVPGPGELVLTETNKVKGTEKQAEAAGKAKLPIKPTGKAKKALNRKGKATVEAEVTYTPTGGASSTQSKKVGLKKR